MRFMKVTQLRLNWMVLPQWNIRRFKRQKVLRMSSLDYVKMAGGSICCGGACAGLGYVSWTRSPLWYVKALKWVHARQTQYRPSTVHAPRMHPVDTERATLFLKQTSGNEPLLCVPSWGTGVPTLSPGDCL